MSRQTFLSITLVAACSSLAFAFTPPPGGGGPGGGGGGASPPTAHINSHFITANGGYGSYDVSATASFTVSCPLDHVDDEEIMVWSDINLTPGGVTGEQNFQIYAGQTTSWSLSTGVYSGAPSGLYTSTAELDVVDFNLENPDWITPGPSVITQYLY